MDKITFPVPFGVKKEGVSKESSQVVATAAAAAAATIHAPMPAVEYMQVAPNVYRFKEPK